ncbi:MAG: hypothetical protein IJL54_08695 [Prevotella sp.]|nr:hypothetical protein [Prevotella sp.]MBR6715024.1 hypothetical protein [Prevotella sp.]
MTQMILDIGDHTMIPELKKILKRISGIDKIQVIRDTNRKKTNRDTFINDFREAVGQAKDFKEGKIEFGTWEEMINEL